MSAVPQQVPHVYTAIRRVIEILKASGIAKANRNKQQGFNYRGIDDIHNALAPALVEAQLIMLPRVITRSHDVRATKSGESALYFVTLGIEYDLISVVDGSRHTISVVGEAMDSADKATNKAMSVAYKYAAIQAFSIPVVGDGMDADEEGAPPDGFEPPKVWTKELIDAANRAVSGGIASYNTWWRNQSQEFRMSAISTPEHLNAKAEAERISKVAREAKAAEGGN